MSGKQLELEIVVDQFFGENCYLASLEGQDECLIIDPGLEPAKIVEQLDQLSLNPVAILNTHGHIDHIAGNAVIKERWPDCPLVIGAGDAHKLTDPEANLSGNYGLPIMSPPPRCGCQRRRLLRGSRILIRNPRHARSLSGSHCLCLESALPMDGFRR